MNTTNKKSSRYSPEVRERAVRMVLDQQHQYSPQWAAISSISEKIGCADQTLLNWVRQAERDLGLKPGPTAEEREEIKALKREVRELRQDRKSTRLNSSHVAISY